MERHGTPTEKQMDDACLWLAKASGGSLSSSDRQAFKIWLEADPAHVEAYRQAGRTWKMMEDPALAFATQCPGGREPLSPHPVAHARFHGPRLQAVAAFALLFATLWFTGPGLWLHWHADMVAGRDVVTDYALPDGSLARLGAGTALSLRFDEASRHVELLNGMAFFEVTPGSNPPFTVGIAGDGVKVTGTRFNVERAGTQTIVTVEEGKVEVRGGQDRGARLLRQGDRILLDEGLQRPVETVDMNDALAWMSGRLVVQDEKVADVLLTLQRHSREKLFASPALASRRISGTLALDDIEGSLSTIAAATGAEVMTSIPFVSFVY